MAVRGLDWDNSREVALILLGNQGPVWIEDGGDVDLGFFESVGAAISNCDSVVLRDIRLAGGFQPSDAYNGLQIDSSTVAVYGCEIVGPDESGAIARDGGSGVVILDDSTVTVYGSTIRGGDGADFLIKGSTGFGGDAIRVHGDGNVVEVIGSTLIGGQGGPGSADGRQLSVNPFGGNVATQLPNTAHFFTTPSPLRSGDPTSVSLVGDPLDRAWVLISTEPGVFMSRPRWVGPLVLPQTLTIWSLGTLDGTGNLTWNLNAPTLPLDVSVLSFDVQGLFLSTSPAEIALGTPTQINVLGPAF